MEGGSPDLHLLELGWSQPLPLALTNQFCVVPPQSTTLVRATSGPHLIWHCILDSLLSVRVHFLQQRSPNASTWWDWVTVSILKWYPFGGELTRASIGKSQHPSYLPGESLPGDFLIWFWVPHSRKLPGDLLLDVLRMWTSCVSSYQSISSCWSVGS